MKRILFALALTVCSIGIKAQSQCGIENTAFQSGEFLAYDVYFNWQFVWLKVGQATMSTVMSTYEGLPAYRTSLITSSNEKIESVFVMRDTLVSYCSIADLSPLYFRKGAREGKRYYIDELWYSYPNQYSKVKMHRVNRHGKHEWKEMEHTQCVYDMMSIFLRARNFDASTMKKGDVIPLPVTDARKLTDSWMVFQGKEKFKLDSTGEKFRCLVFSFFEREDDSDNELLRIYVTDDKNHIPVRIDTFLSFGSAKIFLKAYQGVRSPMTSKLK